MRVVKLLDRTVLALAAAGALAHFLVWSTRFATWPWVLSKGEGICLWSADQLLRGHLPYPDPALPPFSMCAYPIGYPVLAAGFLFLFGKGLFGLRILSVLSEAVAAIAAASILARRTGRPHGHAWAALLLGLLSVHKFHAMARVDLPVLALVVLAVAQLVRFVDERRPGALVALAAAAAGAMLVKPTAAATLAVATGWAAFALRGAPRDLGRLGVALLAGAAAWAAATFALQAATGGEYLHQTVGLHADKGTWPSGWIWEGFRDQYLPMLVAGAVALLLPADPLLKLLACTAAVWAAVSTRAAGSDLNYTLEPLTWITLLVASASAELLRRADRAAGPMRAGALRAACLAAVIAAVLPLRGGPVRARELSPEIRAEGQELSRLMAEAEGVTLSEEPFFAVLHRKDLLVTDAFGLSVLTANGQVDPAALVMELDEGRVARVFLGARLRADSAIVGALRRNYRQIYVTRNQVADTRWIVLDPVRAGTGP